MEMLPVTIALASALALIQIPMTFAVGIRRLGTGIQFWDEGDITLRRRMRAHGNFTETVPITLIVLAAAEWSGTPDLLLWCIGGLFVAGRLIHYWTLLVSGFGNGRAIGMVLTFLGMGGFALCALYYQLLG